MLPGSFVFVKPTIGCKVQVGGIYFQLFLCAIKIIKNKCVIYVAVINQYLYFDYYTVMRYSYIYTSYL